MRQIIALISIVYDFGKIFVFPLCQNSDMQKQRITRLIIIRIRPMLWLFSLKQKSLQGFMLQTRTDAKSGPCQRCRIIRSFIMFTFMLVILAIVGGKKLEAINFLTPAWFATAIIALGLCGFLIKLVSWKLFNKII